MNQFLIGTLALLLMCQIGFGKTTKFNESTNTNNGSINSTHVSSKPFRLSAEGYVLHAGIVKPSASFTVEESSYKSKINSSVPLEQAFGLSFGISFLPLRAFGWNTQITQLFVNQNISKIKYKTTIERIQRTEGNLLFAFNDILFAKAGLNLSTISMTNTDYKPNSSIGYQFGVGLQVMGNLGMHLDYISMQHQTNNTYTFNGIDVSKNLNTDATGLEFGVSALF